MIPTQCCLDCFLITRKTLNIDNPKLNCRIRGLSKHSPRRVILDKNLSTKQTSYIFKTSNRKNTIIIYNIIHYNLTL